MQHAAQPTHPAAPQTLQQAMAYFSDPQRCINYMVRKRWPDGKVLCPTCGSANVAWVPSRRLFQCKTRHAKCQFSVKVGTVMEESLISLDKWLVVGWMLGTCRNGISSYEVARTVGVTQKSAWFMLHRLRFAMTIKGAQLSGVIEGDETYVGGREYNRHLSKRKGSSGRNLIGKTPVMGLVERGGSVVAQVVPSVHARNVLPIIEGSVIKDESLLITDDYPIYDPLRGLGFAHETIAHSRSRYVTGPIHTNTIENFWACLKRTLKGTYVAVSPKHLEAYVAEQVFRFNLRRQPIEEMRLAKIVAGAVGKRLMYRELVAN